MLARLRNDERGQVLPALMVTAVVTIALSFMLFQVGRATTMSAQAQTGADAAAIAGAEGAKVYLIAGYLVSCATTTVCEYPEMVPYAVVCGPAMAYAGHNKTYLLPGLAGCRWDQANWTVTVHARTTEALDGRYGLPGTRGQQAAARARAEVTPPRAEPPSVLDVRLRSLNS